MATSIAVSNGLDGDEIGLLYAAREIRSARCLLVLGTSKNCIQSTLFVLPRLETEQFFAARSTGFAQFLLVWANSTAVSNASDGDEIGPICAAQGIRSARCLLVWGTLKNGIRKTSVAFPRLETDPLFATRSTDFVQCLLEKATSTVDLNASPIGQIFATREIRALRCFLVRATSKTDNGDASVA